MRRSLFLIRERDVTAIAAWCFGMLLVRLFFSWRGRNQSAGFIVRGIVSLPLWAFLVVLTIGYEPYMHGTGFLFRVDEIACCALAWMVTGIPKYWDEWRARRTWHDDLFDVYGLDPESGGREIKAVALHRQD